MDYSVRILLPIFQNNIVYFKGYISIAEQHELFIYITDYAVNYEDLTRKQNIENELYGICSEFSIENIIYVNTIGQSENILVLEKGDLYRIQSLTFKGITIKNPKDCILMLYDRKKFKSSENISESNDHFSKLQMLLKEDCVSLHSRYRPIEEPIKEFSQWLSLSMFAQHLLNYFHLINWLISTLRREKKVSLKLGNLILAIVTDIALGYIILELLAPDKKALGINLMAILERLVNMLYSLLKWLMGSPAGLKLNNAFNKMLGKYFSYHIELWWLFLDVSGEKLDVILQVYYYLGYIGLTFQAAIVSDLICIATFHSYCIYVYAARLFNLQISGLIALLRLFVGRKYNPLRGGIDSCEYTNQELFVGTVAVTILLLLLPTTAMYYIVFTLFRLLSLWIQYILAKLIYVLQTLPLYVMTLWLVRSPKVAGNILLKLENEKEGTPLVLRVELFNRSLHELFEKCKPPVKAPKRLVWATIFSNMVRGKQIIYNSDHL